MTPLPLTRKTGKGEMKATDVAGQDECEVHIKPKTKRPCIVKMSSLRSVQDDTAGEFLNKP